MVDFNPYIQIQPTQQVREIRNLGTAQATGQVVAPAFDLGKALGQLAPSLAEMSKQGLKKEQAERQDEQTAYIQALAEQETEAKLGELIHQRVKTGDLPPGYSPYMMDLLERQAGRRAFRDYRRAADQALKAFNDPDYAGDPDEVLASIQAEVLGRYGAADQGAKFLAEFITLRGDVRDAFTSNAVKTRSAARQQQGLNGFADDVQVAISEFGDDPNALNNALANLMQEAAGSSVFVGMPKGKLAEIMGTSLKGEVERLIQQEDFEEARTLLDNFRVLNPRSRRLNGTPGDDESTDARQANSFAYDHGTLIATLEASLEDKEASVERRDGLRSLATAESTAASVLKVIQRSEEAREWMDGLPADISDAELEQAAEEWLNEVGFNLDRVASLGVDLTERVKTLVLSSDLGATVQGRVQAERIKAFREGPDFEGILAMPLSFSGESADRATRMAAREAGISEEGIQGLVQYVRTDRNTRRNEVVAPASDILNKKKAAALLAEWRRETATMTPEELRKHTAAKLTDFEALGDEYANEFIIQSEGEQARRRELTERSLRDKRQPIIGVASLARNLVTNELMELVQAAGMESKELSQQSASEIDNYQESVRQELEDRVREIAYTAAEEDRERLIADALRDTRERVKEEAPEFAQGLMRGKAKIVDGRTASQGGQVTVPIKSTFGGFFAADNDDINDYLNPLQTAAKLRTAPLAWQEVWKKDEVHEFKLEVDSAKQIVRKALSGDHSLTLSDGKFVQGEKAWDVDDIEVDEATNAAAMTHIDAILDIYSPINAGRGRDIFAGRGSQRLDRFGVEIDPRLLDPQKVPVLSLNALEDPAAQQAIADYNAALEESRIKDAEDIISEWLAGDSISAKEYKLLLPKYQQNPGLIWARQEQFYRAWEATRKN